MALTVKEAIEAARAYLADLYPESASSLRMEEIERQGSDWAITLSMSGPTFGAGEFGFGRVAKVVVVDGANGSFVSLKQRAA